MAGNDLSRERLTLVLIVLAVLLFVLPLTLDIPLVDPDEGLHAAIAQEMVERSSYLQPSLLGEPFLDKPILYFWAQALSLKMFGMTQVGVRLPGLMFGLLGVMTTALLGRTLFGPIVGLLAGCFYATLTLPLAVSQAATHDIAMIPWINLAMLFLWRADQTQDRAVALRSSAIAGLWLGLSILTKGLAGIVIVLGGFSVWAVLRGRSMVAVASLVAVTLCSAVAVALPWFAYVNVHAPGYLYYYFVERHVLGYATDSQRHGGAPFLYYLPVLVGGGLPWVLYLPAAFRERRRVGTRWWSIGGARDLLWLWLLVGLGFLTLGSSKLAVYLLPIFPAVAILAADAWVTRLSEAPRTTPSAVFSTGLALQVAAGALLLPVTVLLVVRRYNMEVDAVTLGAAVVMVALYLLLFRRRPLASLVIGCLALWALGLALVITLVFPRVAHTISARDLASHFNRAGRMPAHLLIVDDRVGSVVFYLTPELRAGLDATRIESIGMTSAGERIAAAPAGALVAVRQRRLAEFRDTLRVQAPCRPDGEFCILAVAPLQQELSLSR